MQMKESRVEDLATHLGDKVLPNFTDRFIVVLDRLERRYPGIGDVAFSPLSPSPKSIICGDWHDTWNDGDCDSFGSALLDPAEKDVDIVKHLSDNERCTCVNLLLQMVNQKIYIFLVFTTLGIPSNANVEMIAVFGLDVLYEVFGVLETVLFRLPLLLLPWRVTSQG